MSIDIVSCKFKDKQYIVKGHKGGSIGIKANYPSEKNNLFEVIIEDCDIDTLKTYSRGQKKGEFKVVIRNSKIKNLSLYSIREIQCDDWNMPFKNVLISGSLTFCVDNKFQNIRGSLNLQCIAYGLLSSNTLKQVNYFSISRKYHEEKLLIDCPNLMPDGASTPYLVYSDHNLMVYPSCTQLFNGCAKFNINILLENTPYPDLKILMVGEDSGVIDFSLFPTLRELVVCGNIKTPIVNPRKLEIIKLKGGSILNKDTLDLLPECNDLQIRHNVNYYETEADFMDYLETTLRLDTYIKADKITIFIGTPHYDRYKFGKYQPICKEIYLDFWYVLYLFPESIKSLKINLHDVALEEELLIRRTKQQKSARK